MKRIFLFIVVLFLACSTCWGQVLHVTASGESTISERKAIEEAEIRALEAAGIEVSVESISTTSLSNGKASSSFNRRTAVNSQALIKVCGCEVTKDRGLYIANINADVAFMPSTPSLHVFGLQEKYAIDKSLYFNLSFNDKSYLTILWFDEDSRECGILTDGLYVTSDRLVRFPEGDKSYRNTIAKHFDSRETVEDVNSCGETVYKRVYTEQFFANKTWGTVTNPQKKVRTKNISLVFLTTPDYNPFIPKSYYFTKDDFVDWYFDLPLEQRRRIVEKKIVLEI